MAYEYGEWSDEEEVTLTDDWTEGLGQVQNLEAVQSGLYAVTLTWDEVDGADAYEIYRTVSGQHWTIVVEETTWVDVPQGNDPLWNTQYNVADGIVVQYKVRARSGEA